MRAENANGREYEGLRYACEIRPRFEDADAYGVIHHSKYLLYVEEAKFAFMRDPAMFGMNAAGGAFKFPVTEIGLRYARAVRYEPGIALNVRLRFSIPDGVRVRFDYEIFHPGGRVCCRGYAVHAATDANDSLLLALPEALTKRYEEIKADKEDHRVCES
ncbi:hypothetical protein CDO73_01360 [Saccharibacillus sp. O23]|uniref:acyl-CoA thioesterase n=1 Tax=Saccharibacillus sp. O23 TaxID=2009338 RepID=UPI000B4E8096|nr:thioesterase family protein [Saccharibacillus sp. O23]OWR33181.1 hypothetical protein CDO73_01360 [Saccharibacillus sp. O23]